MTTYPYTGKVTSFSETAVPNAEPRLWVQPKFPAIGPNGPLITRPVPASIAEDGTFTLNLLSSVDTTPKARYVLHVEWIATGGFSQGWSTYEFDAQLGGGPIKLEGVPLSVWFEVPPWPEQMPPGFYFHKPTNNVYRKDA